MSVHENGYGVFEAGVGAKQHCQADRDFGVSLSLRKTYDFPT